ncbi:hypothetical protein [Paenibacillus daejeonensis]|uniref:hypothetical protein n=1 Tax=Paenibacillus daejeonensis TaxID=135193 RepID=UPI00037BD882|nr:hypothetical protein [Paenibacillus daejeonensis]
MSVSLAMVPVALTMRLVMGKDNFDNWVSSMQVKEPTTFKTELELARTVRKAGYDAEKWGGSIKTHLEGERHYFFWECIDGIWTAIFSTSESRERIERLMADVNEAAGRQVFEQQEFQPATNLSSSFPTNFRDGELLFKTLKEFGINPVRQGSGMTCKVEQSVLTFHQNGDSPFQVTVQNAPELRSVFEYLSDVDEEYKRCVQEVVYRKLKARAAAQNMTVESEEVMEDQSIVLTLNIRS